MRFRASLSLVRKVYTMSAIKVPAVKLATGHDFPVVGLGTYKTSGNPEQLVTAIKKAVEYGYRHFDLALCYENEDVIGKAFKEVFEESKGTLKREDFFITDKLWNTYHSKEAVPQCIDLQLKSLGFDYFDLYLMHWAFGFKENSGSLYPTDETGHFLYSDVHYLEAYKAMEDLVDQGKARSIGVSNFSISQLQDVLKNCRIKPAVNQVEVHPFYQNNELIKFCQDNGIVVTAYAPLGAPDRGWLQSTDPVVLENPVILDIAKKHGKSPGQVCLKWVLQRGLTAVPKSVTPSRLRDNIDLNDFTLTDEDMKQISTLDKGFQYYGWTETKDHQYYPFK